MKKSLSVLFAAALVLAFSAMAMAGTTPGSGIDGTSHDLSSTGGSAAWGDAVEQGGGNGHDRICVYCHAPHHTLRPDTTNTYVPLWNHVMSTRPASAFTPYTNGTDNNNFGTSTVNIQHQSIAALLGNAPGSVSMLCLSCHDGTVGTNEYGYAPSTSSNRNNPQQFTAASRAGIGIGGDLSNHHPIGFNYLNVQATDAELADPSASVVGTRHNGPTQVQDLLWGGAVAGGTMECVTCHDVHNTQNGGLKFLWVDDTHSALCLTCHLKANLN
jgi:predicted CXXCH cytochrome family protein